MPPVGFEPMISAGELPQTYALDRAATGTGLPPIYIIKTIVQKILILYCHLHLELHSGFIHPGISNIISLIVNFVCFTIDGLHSLISLTLKTLDVLRRVLRQISWLRIPSASLNTSAEVLVFFFFFCLFLINSRMPADPHYMGSYRLLSNPHLLFTHNRPSVSLNVV